MATLKQGSEAYRQQKSTMFRAEDHLIEISTPNGKKKYLPVEWAIIWFRIDNPDGEITTEEIFVDLDKEFEYRKSVWSKAANGYIDVVNYGKGYARYKATITISDGGKATGYKTANGAAHKDFCEMAESGAIRRALSNLGYGTEYSQLDEQE